MMEECEWMTYILQLGLLALLCGIESRLTLVDASYFVGFGLLLHLFCRNLWWWR